MTSASVPVTTADLRRWTQDSRIPGDPPPLSDDAALLIAAGHISPAGRALMVRRMSAGLPLPRLPYPYVNLRRLQHSITYIEQQLSTGVMPNVVATVLRTRLAGMLRKREDARRVVVIGKGVFATSTRAIRRERRENLYLEIEERERLFNGLLVTPTADLPSGGGVRRAGSAAVDRIAGFVGGLAGRGAASSVQEWIDEALGSSPGSATVSGRGGSGFSDGYETLQFIAGHFYDRIQRSPAWRSDFFEMQRTQVNLHAELAEIAADIVTLRGLRVDLDRARASGGFDQGFADHLDQRESTLRPVWTELLERVQALVEIAQTVESAAVELRILDEYDRASTLDARIDHLLARSGDRELSADNTRRLSEQVRAGEEQLRVYRDVLQGNISRILPHQQYRELPERYEPER
ncbi:hypothetical protein MYK68_01185 [Gordonia sp. PP30]|uniref:hypothetical protein n=1 Tax=unclassified Gordonia (in: high G+C Gram-positive bacteria) TaxID=2657482 RepID=UPI001FFF6030|nr:MULTISPECIES: hypothetical protein [unclassified Gordonia (in: high G+C Gram-positive bacteria)]UQE75285.1 hypothetical protein MYK68_01185 [Gordonia sp. PP30]